MDPRLNEFAADSVATLYGGQGGGVRSFGNILSQFAAAGAVVAVASTYAPAAAQASQLLDMPQESAYTMVVGSEGAQAAVDTMASDSDRPFAKECSWVGDLRLESAGWTPEETEQFNAGVAEIVGLDSVSSKESSFDTLQAFCDISLNDMVTDRAKLGMHM